jgi:hypothetical protein
MRSLAISACLMAQFEHSWLIDEHATNGGLIEPPQLAQLLGRVVALERVGSWLGGGFDGIDHELSLAVLGCPSENTVHQTVRALSAARATIKG